MPAPKTSATPVAPAENRALPLLIILFIGSGTAALVYEIVWLQMLQLLIGSTGVSLAVLLGTFMGGMCLGSLALPRLISADHHPLRVYAALELGIGIVGLAIAFGFSSIEALYTSFGSGASGIFMRGVVSAICLLPPTILMGATLPAIARWVEATPRGVSWLGLFYGANIAGAVVGCLLAGFYLLPRYDMVIASLVAVAINAVVALLAVALAKVTPGRAIAQSAPRNDAARAAAAGSIYVAIAISGLSALGAEVVWTRTLSLLLGGTTYTFSIILAVFLVGLGIGSNIGALLTRGNLSPRMALGMCQILLVGAIAWTAYMVSSSLPYWPIDPSLSVRNDPQHGPWLMFQLDIVRVLWAILPAACLWGASFPLALAAVAAPGQDPGRLVGGVYATNTVGAILGSVCFGLFIVPRFGTQGAQQLLIGLSMLAALIALLPMLGSAAEPATGERRPSLGLVVLLLVATVAAVWLGSRVRALPWSMVAYGRQMATSGRDFDLRRIYQHGTDIPREDPDFDEFCIYTREGMNVSVAVTETKNGVRRFHGAGKVQASSEPQDMRLQRMLGHLSALAVENPKKVLVVACGAGVTAGSFMVHPEVEQITICDIEPVVPQFVTPHFSHENYGITDDMVGKREKIHNGKKVKLEFDDGRHFVRTTPEKYDVITSDPIDPWVKGCASLNTVEYYQMCKDHLNDGGVMTLWIPLYESNEETFKCVLTTFFEVFPNGILWSNDYSAQGYDAVLFGIKVPEGKDPKDYHINLDDFAARLARPDHAEVVRSLDEVGFATPMDLLATYAGRASDLDKGGWTDRKLLNYDRNLRLQYLAGMWLNSYLGTEILGGVLKHYRYPTELFTGNDANLHEALKSALANGGRYEAGTAPLSNTEPEVSVIGDGTQ